MNRFARTKVYRLTRSDRHVDNTKPIEKYKKKEKLIFCSPFFLIVLEFFYFLYPFATDNRLRYIYSVYVLYLLKPPLQIKCVLRVLSKLYRVAFSITNNQQE